MLPLCGKPVNAPRSIHPLGYAAWRKITVTWYKSWVPRLFVFLGRIPGMNEHAASLRVLRIIGSLGACPLGRHLVPDALRARRGPERARPLSHRIKRHGLALCRRTVGPFWPVSVVRGSPGSTMRGLLRRIGFMAAVPLLGLLTVAAVIVGTSDGPNTGGPERAAAVQTFSSWLDEAQVQATTNAQWATVARDNAIVVLNSWDFRLIPLLKRANPKVQVWVYKDLSGVRSDDCTGPGGNCGACARGVTDSIYLSSGMGYCWVKRHHPDWLLDAAGTGLLLQFRGYPQIWETDYGNASYQRQWAQNVLADVRDHGWDGVAVDNALTTADTYGVAAKYPTDATVQSATYSALQTIGSALRDTGVPAVFNVGYATEFPGLWQRWLGPVDGLEQEFYLSYSTKPNAADAEWSTYEDEITACTAQHKSCWFHSGAYSDAVTSQTRQYALASFLLATDGKQYLSVGSRTSGSLEPRLALGGRPSEMFQVGASWRRYFAQGVAVVNPSMSTLVVPLDGTYLNVGRRVQTIVLGPASGAVLRAADSGADR
jgi:putative glycosyl hydrolase-like family 15 (GHL15) protein